MHFLIQIYKFEYVKTQKPYTILELSIAIGSWNNFNWVIKIVETIVTNNVSILLRYEKEKFGEKKKKKKKKKMLQTAREYSYVRENGEWQFID